MNKYIYNSWVIFINSKYLLESFVHVRLINWTHLFHFFCLSFFFSFFFQSSFIDLSYYLFLFFFFFFRSLFMSLFFFSFYSIYDLFYFLSSSLSLVGFLFFFLSHSIILSRSDSGNYWILKIRWPEFEAKMFDPDHWCAKPLYIFSVVHLGVVYAVIGISIVTALSLAVCRVLSCPWFER